MDIGITGQTLKRMAQPSASLQEVTWQKEFFSR